MEDNYQELAKQMVEKIKRIKYQYVDVSDTIETLEEELHIKMSKMAGTLSTLHPKEKDLLTLFIINEVHRAVDDMFKENPEGQNGNLTEEHFTS